MTIDITTCHKINIIDSCALWNVFSSQVFLSVLEDQQFNFSCTDYVIYECLYSKRSNPTVADDRLQQLTKTKLAQKKLTKHPLTIEDLQDEQILKYRKKLGRGELSSIAFAKKTNLCFLTDDKQARKLATEILGKGRVQTTPLLLGFLLFKGYLGDADLETIINDHKNCERPLEKYFREVHAEAWRIKLLIKY